MQRTIPLARKNEISENIIYKIFEQVPIINAERKQQGLDPVLSLGIGEPHLEMNPVAYMALQEFMSEPKNIFAFNYSPVRGRPDTLDAISRLYNHYYPNLKYTCDEVMMTNGASQGLWNALNILVQKDDVVLTFEPYYSKYVSIIGMLGARLEKIDTCTEHFRPTAAQLRAALEKHKDAKVLLMNYPNNPCGVELADREAKSLSEVLQDFPHIAIIIDDVYRELSASEHVTLIDAHPELKDRSIVINSGSKGLVGAPDMRAGMVGAPAEWIRAMADMQAAVSGAPLLSQIALVAAINSELMADPEYTAWKKKTLTAYQRNMQYMSQQLELCGMRCMNENNGFFLLADASVLIGCELPDIYESRNTSGSMIRVDNIHAKIGSNKCRNDTDIVNYLMHVAGVAVIPGSGFGVDEKLGYIRISCAKSMRDLMSAVTKIRSALSVIPQFELMEQQTIRESMRLFANSRPRQSAGEQQSNSYVM